MKLAYLLLSFSTMLITTAKANENFSVEIEALTLVMEKYQEEIKGDGTINLENPNYVAFKLDEFWAKVKLSPLASQNNGLALIFPAPSYPPSIFE